MKTCSKCKEEKPFADFYKRKVARDGLKSSCKVCNNAAKAAYLNAEANAEKSKATYADWYKANFQRISAKKAAHRKANLEKCRLTDAGYRKANPEQYREADRNWRKANPEKYKAQTARNYWANPEKSRAKGIAWRTANPEKLKAGKAAYIQAMPDAFVKQLIFQGTGLPRELIPQEVIEAKRTHLQLVRKIKELKS